MKVHRDLNAIVFGESVMNDAVTITLYKTIINLNESNNISS